MTRARDWGDRRADWLPVIAALLTVRAVVSFRRVALGFFVAAILAVSPFAAAHPGGLDASGCHMNRKTGEYHCHRAPVVPPTAPGNPSPPEPLVTPESTPIVKKSRSGICHASGSRYYAQTLQFIAYESIKACWPAGEDCPGSIVWSKEVSVRQSLATLCLPLHHLRQSSLRPPLKRSELANCATITDSLQRLTCYDDSTNPTEDRQFLTCAAINDSLQRLTCYDDLARAHRTTALS